MHLHILNKIRVGALMFHIFLVRMSWSLNVAQWHNTNTTPRNEMPLNKIVLLFTDVVTVPSLLQMKVLQPVVPTSPVITSLSSVWKRIPVYSLHVISPPVHQPVTL